MSVHQVFQNKPTQSEEAYSLQLGETKGYPSTHAVYLHVLSLTKEHLFMLVKLLLICQEDR